MEKEKSLSFQYVRLMPALACLMLGASLLGGCANSFDQTKDLNNPTSNMVRIATQMHAQGDDEGAAEFYRRALARDPQDVDAHKGLADLFVAHGDYVSAAGQYHALVELRPDDAGFRRAYGGVLLRLNRAADAKDQYVAALRIDSGDVKARNGLGVTLDYMGDHRAARAQYKKILDDDAHDMPALSNLAHSYVLSGQYKSAIRLLEPVYRNPKTPPALRQNLAEAYALAGMDVDAERVARIDLPPAEVAKNLAFYHAERARLVPPAVAIYADLGAFDTPALADMRARRLKAQFVSGASKLVFEVVPKVAAVGGTPEFFVHVRGFSGLADAAAFCGQLKKKAVFCKVGP